MFTRKLLSRILPLVILSGTADLSFADSEALKQFLDCSEIESHLTRLDCYDQAARSLQTKPLRKPDQRPASAVPESSPEDIVTTAPSVRTRAPQSLPEDLGAPPRVSREEKKGFTTTITRVERLSRGNYSLTLSGGQVWQEIEQDPRTRYAVGDEVVLRRGLFGSFNLYSNVTERRAKVRRIDIEED